ncbi:hypothetical protein B0A50_02742 [Salinomyces thailandicus]|uniref:Copper acquisition factor BIM1-like domain-containing protein n=1 Tax=Salinomyces thailandicus TaxID=706561 RepID=A0A4U0U4J5_9PEZI|nr:hypothetical protein B0A50_02742 [Salinomyces thailandica]
MQQQLLLALATATLSSAHFVLLWPPTAGFDEDTLSNGPCGGAQVAVNDSSPSVQIDRFAISIQNTHPEGEWLFRGTTDTDAPYTWTDLVPVVNTTGLGNFCLDAMSAPDDFAGKAGIIQVVDNSPDGTLYQCAPVNFVAGSNDTTGSNCRNTTGFMATWTNLQSLDGVEDGSGSMSGSMTMSNTASASDAAASSTSAGVAAAITGVGSIVGGVGLLAAVLAL